MIICKSYNGKWIVCNVVACPCTVFRAQILCILKQSHEQRVSNLSCHPEVCVIPSDHWTCGNIQWLIIPWGTTQNFNGKILPSAVVFVHEDAKPNCYKIKTKGKDM